jgi:hypothetical protein
MQQIAKQQNGQKNVMLEKCCFHPFCIGKIFSKHSSTPHKTIPQLIMSSFSGKKCFIQFLPTSALKVICINDIDSRF